MALQNKIVCNIEQNLTAEEKATARKNIGVSDTQLPDIADAAHGDVLTVIRSGAYGTKSVTWQHPAGGSSIIPNTLSIPNIVWEGPLTSGTEKGLYSTTLPAGTWCHWTLCGNLLSSGSTNDTNGIYVKVYMNDTKIYEHAVYMPRVGTGLSITECPFSVTLCFGANANADTAFRFVLSNTNGVNSLLQATNLKLSMLMGS